MWGSRLWLWASTKRQLVDDVARLERMLAHTDAQLAKARTDLARERQAALARRLPAELATVAETLLGTGGITRDLSAAAAALRTGQPIREAVRGPLADLLEDHAHEHSSYDCPWAEHICPAGRTARALTGEAR
ncbi:hypothetical protein [Sphaerimonospora thailandensis]|uniref:Uncharacterized protein n=1 Tax=Sphaerimonospora thailandensis TaxID=795644 RepID=A0A8J3RD22_9ACTN|nr:hypothetical protein [Sphaerimonospora thailandensis]GIH70288.1 hypothetical protein Mth01_25410 [Sphaerimonospora thailandensis]